MELLKLNKDDKIMILENYLSELQEVDFGRRGASGRKPSPSFAYELVFKKPAPPGRRGRPPFPVEYKNWNGIQVDKHLDNKWIKDLNNIPNVEVRGSCEGHDEDWVSYVAFRLDPKYDNNKSFLNKVASRLNKDSNTVAGFEIGMQGRPRFVVATPLYYECDKQDEWKKWWTTLASRLNKTVNS